MTALILMLLWLSQVLPVMSDLPRPLNVMVNSSHFHHMLQWKAGVGTPQGVYYKVSFMTDEEISSKPVSGCQHIKHPLVCNLTGAFSNPKKKYYASVTAVLDEQSSVANSGAFQPIRDTHLDPPLLTVTSCGPGLCLNFDPPMENLRTVYNSFEYQLRIKSTNADEPQLREIKSLNEEVLKDLPAGSEYCVSVRILDGISVGIVVKTSNFSQPKCVFIPSRFNADPLIAAVLCVIVIFILVVLGLRYCVGYMCLKKRLPLVLTSIHHTDESLHASSLVSLSSILNVKPTAPSSGGKKSSQTESSDSDEESVTDITGGGGGGGGRGGVYQMRGGTNLLSTSSSSSSSSFSAPLSPNCFPTNQNSLSVPPDVFSALPEAPVTASAPTSTEDSLTAERTEKEEEEEEEEEEGGIREVNLLTLTFGNRKEEKEEEPAHVDLQPPRPPAPPVSEETSILLSHMCHFNEAAEDPDICSDDEEEEDEYDGDNGYMRR